jgi:hypothetical protein
MRNDTVGVLNAFVLVTTILRNFYFCKETD